MPTRGLNFSKETKFLRCLSLDKLIPHTDCSSYLGAINIASLCVENKEDIADPADVVIQGPLLAFTARHTTRDKVVVVNWRQPLRALAV